MNNRISRRGLLKTGAAAGFAAALAKTAPAAFAAGSDTIKTGLVGCGGRGSHAAVNCMQSAPGVELVTIAEMFGDRLEWGVNRMKNKMREDNVSLDKLKFTPETCYLGFDAYKKVLASDIDLVLLATPPHFRPQHLRAALQAGKHVFMEKPVATDVVGGRSVIESASIADRKGLAVVAGTQRRHQNHYLEIMKRIKNGDIGEPVAAQCFWVAGGVAKWGMLHERQPEWSDMENQIRNWYYYVWASGDHIVEQHVHNIDIVNWAMGGPPEKAMGMGGRQVRTGEEFGNIYDHFAVEYEYPNGARALSMCRQTEACSERISENIIGTKGRAYTDASNAFIEGESPYKYKGKAIDPYIQEHADLIESIRAGKPLNETKRVAESTLTGIMGRYSAYTGRTLSWNWIMNGSKLRLGPDKYEMGDLPVKPVRQPGKTELI